VALEPYGRQNEHNCTRVDRFWRAGAEMLGDESYAVVVRLAQALRGFEDY